MLIRLLLCDPVELSILLVRSCHPPASPDSLSPIPCRIALDLVHIGAFVLMGWS